MEALTQAVEALVAAAAETSTGTTRTVNVGDYRAVISASGELVSLTRR